MVTFPSTPSPIARVKLLSTPTSKNTLLFKLGFSLEQLLPRLGLTQNNVNYEYNRYL